MSKMKTKSGAKKRFKITAKGKIKTHQVGKRHRLINNSPARTRDLRGMDLLSKSESQRVKRWMPFTGRRKNNITTANAAVDKSLQHNYIGRKERKRNFRALWIQRINAAVREHGITYSRFIAGLAGAGIEIDRKVLSDLAIHEPTAFKALVDQASKG